MGSSPLVSQQKILAASGDNAALQEVLSQIAQTAATQQAVTGTTPVAGPQQNSSAPVPDQATGYVSVLTNIYTVRIVNPGALSPISAMQNAQQGRNATSLTGLQPVRAIFHQVRASTSPAFNVNSNTQTFGGNTGSAQNLWTLSGLGTGTWYFQFRSSYDGVNFNTWKNANSGAALGGLTNQVTLETAAFSDWALFSLPGSEIMGVVEGLVADQEIMGIPPGFNLYSSGLLAIAGPNGFQTQPNAVAGVNLCDVDIQTPAPGTPVVGIPDYPVEIRMQYQIDGAGVTPGTATVFGVSFNPQGKNVKLFAEGGASSTVWAKFILPGGCPVLIGQGRNLDGETIWTPPSETWVDASRLMSICSLTANTALTGVMQGYGQCQLSGLVMEAKGEGTAGAMWSTSANWFAIAWPAGAPVSVVGGNKFLTISLQGGHSIAFGAGQTASGTPITLPAGYTDTDMLSICTPASTVNLGHHLRGVQQCSFFGLTPLLIYSDNVNTWDGNVNWMVAAWK